MNVDELSRRIVVRHREPGYLRLELPAEISSPEAMQLIETRLRQLAGVYRVSAKPAERRLVTWYETHACSPATIACALKALLGTLPVAAATPLAAPAAQDAPVLPVALSGLGTQARQALGLVRDKVDLWRQPNAPAGSLQARLQPVLASALTEKAVTNFINDLVAFYLIKMHWELISKRWLQDPVKHVNAWLTVFYLVFLLVRYRRSINKPAPAPAAES